MTKRSALNLKRLAILAGVGTLAAFAVAGCKGSDDQPTNTKNSQYMGGGNTEADKVGEQRRKARLPKGGAQ